MFFNWNIHRMFLPVLSDCSNRTFSFAQLASCLVTCNITCMSYWWSPWSLHQVLLMVTMVTASSATHGYRGHCIKCYSRLPWSLHQVLLVVTMVRNICTTAWHGWSGSHKVKMSLSVHQIKSQSTIHLNLLFFCCCWFCLLCFSSWF